jgi:hypothetical protein
MGTRPNLDYNSKDLIVQTAIKNCMNEIVNGLSISAADWGKWFVVPRREVQSTFRKWRELNARASLIAGLKPATGDT